MMDKKTKIKLFILLIILIIISIFSVIGAKTNINDKHHLKKNSSSIISSSSKTLSVTTTKTVPTTSISTATPTNKTFNDVISDCFNENGDLLMYLDDDFNKFVCFFKNTSKNDANPFGHLKILSVGGNVSCQPGEIIITILIVLVLTTIVCNISIEIFQHQYIRTKVFHYQYKMKLNKKNIFIILLEKKISIIL